MNIFQIPKISDVGTDMIIGVIDCSSSMEGNWPWLADHWNNYVPTENCLTITFDSIASIVPDNILSSNINIHGGGGTNITAGFDLMEKEIQKLTEKKNITVIFISDGADNRMTTLEKRMTALKGNDKNHHINFICLGVGSEFPTFVALRLREKYHNGDETLPAIFLIEYVTEKAYTIKFEALKKYFGFNLPRKVTPAVCLFPWREYTESVYETAWILTDSDKLTIDGEIFNVQEYYLNLKGIHELFRSWAQMMHLESLKDGEKIQQRAKKTFQIMTMILEELKSAKGIDFLSNEELSIVGKTFYDRIIFCRTKRDLVRIKWFYNDVKNISEGNYVVQQNQFEAAKRIGMGTITGIFNQKAMALKVTTVTEFAKIKDEFKELLKKYPIQNKIIVHDATTNPQKLKSIREILQDKTFEKALNLCQNQFDFFEAFELNGYPIRITRDKIDLQNPYDIDVKFVDFNHIITSGNVLNTKEAYVLKLPNGKEEMINAVLPLLSEDDGDLIPFLNSRLFKLLMSYNCFLEADKIVDEAYTALLCACNATFIKTSLPQNQKRQVVQKIHQTSKLLYTNLPKEHYFNTSMNLNFESLFYKSDPMTNVRKRATYHESMLKLINAYEDHKIDVERYKDLVKLMMSLVIFESIRHNKSSISNVYDPVLNQSLTLKQQKDMIIQTLKTQFKNFYTMGDLKRALLIEIREAFTSTNASFVFNSSKLDYLLPAKTSFTNLKQLLQLYVMLELTEKELENVVITSYSATCEGALQTITNDTIFTNKQNIEKFLKSKQTTITQCNPSSKKNKNKRQEQNMLNNKVNQVFIDMIYFAEKEFRIFFSNIHREIYPFTEDEMKSFCWSNKIQRKDIAICKQTLLPTGVCSAPQCEFFFKKGKRLAHHMAIWGELMPQGFHALVKENRKLTTEEIYQLFLKKAQLTALTNPNDTHSLVFGRTKPEVLAYIQKLQIAYSKLLG